MVQLASGKGCAPVVIHRVHIAIRGAVQGVGFRPFVYRLASDLCLPGWVMNSPQGVFIEVEGEKEVLEAFLLRLEKEKLPRASIQSLECTYLDPVPFTGFHIRESDLKGDRTTIVLADIATCPDCVHEIFDPENRRYRYPFTNCTHCGPRFSIIEALPYDRANTSMHLFDMCPECSKEYRNPADRRFHAQPNACPDCGPRLELWDPAGKSLAVRNEALKASAAAIKDGKIVAVKGLGGFHLFVQAGDEAAVTRLRERKHREEKPLALMYPALAAISADCEVSALEERLLLSAESPIVLLQRRQPTVPRNTTVASAVAPHNPYLGAMLPYTPLHHLLMREVGSPVVATSGNISDEPICTDENEALERLRGIADVFLVHNRPIVRHVDDSIVRVMLGRELVLRRARGYAPLPLQLKQPSIGILAVGGQLKNAIALTVGRNVFVSQHIGDLENREASDAFRKVVASFRHLYETEPEQLAADLHPDYVSTRFADAYGAPVTAIQHHYAHVAACMAENELEGTVLGVSWDGTGLGLDGSIWGGEFLLTDDTTFRRVATFRRFRLPGGERAVREPRRTALGILYEILGDSLSEVRDLAPMSTFAEGELAVLRRMLRTAFNSPLTSSAGRLFDGVASLTGLRQKVNFEGQAAMELEFAIDELEPDEAYPMLLTESSSSQEKPPGGNNLLVFDWEPMIRAIIDDIRRRVSPGGISRKFHNALVEVIVAVARRIGESKVVLTGGCFQNKYLAEHAVRRLEAAGFRPYWHQRVPPNDGGIALGQAVAAAKMLRLKVGNQDTPRLEVKRKW